MPKVIESISIRRVGNGFIMRTSTVEKSKDPKVMDKWDDKEEIFLDVNKASKAIGDATKKL